MDWLLKFVVIWLSIDILTIATAWYAVTVIKPHCPNWWKQVIADYEPKSEKLPHPPLTESSQYHQLSPTVK